MSSAHSEKPSTQRGASLVVRCASFGEVAGSLAFGAVMLPLLWVTCDAVNEPWAYTARGAALMLWPCQWAFWLGRKSVISVWTNVKSEPRSQQKNP